MMYGGKSLRSLLISFLVTVLCVANVSAQFGRKARLKKAEEEAAAAAAAAAAARSQVMQLDKSTQGILYITTLILAMIVGIVLVEFAYSGPSEVIKVDAIDTTKEEKKTEKPTPKPVPTPAPKVDPKPKIKGNRPEAPVDIVIVGCGLPKRGMGWYHLTQLVETTNVNVAAIVEPFFLNSTLCKDPPPAWTALVKEYSAKGVKFATSVADIGEKFTRPTICLIAGRTVDNPKLFSNCIDQGAQVIYLEKPGAPSVGELQTMKKQAEEKKVTVYIGYNKNVTSYVQSALDSHKKAPKSSVYFVHNNEYKEAELPECFTRNAEGMLKNMAVHELALLVTFFDVTVDNIKTFLVNKKTTIKKTLKRTDAKGGTITDFSKVDFTITTKTGKTVSVMANRCGGSVSYAEVKGADGKVIAKHEFPTAEISKKVAEQKKADPAMMPYFFLQSDDYLELKNRVIASLIEGKKAQGLATLEIGIEALKLAEYGTDQLHKAVPK